MLFDFLGGALGRTVASRCSVSWQGLAAWGSFEGGGPRNESVSFDPCVHHGLLDHIVKGFYIRGCKRYADETLNSSDGIAAFFCRTKETAIAAYPARIQIAVGGPRWILANSARGKPERRSRRISSQRLVPKIVKSSVPKATLTPAASRPRMGWLS